MDFFFLISDVEVKRQKALKDALEIRRQRHNYRTHIRQFTASIAVS